MSSTQQSFRGDARAVKKESTGSAFFWLGAFYFLYCARPEDWVPGLGHVPLAKITIFFVLLGFLTGSRKARRSLRQIPREAKYLLCMIAVLLLSAALSPIWRGGAVYATLEFAKVSIAWVLAFLLVTTIGRFRRLVYIYAGSVASIAAIILVKGHSVPRLEAVLQGTYSNPNDLAFSIVLALPFCLAFMLTAKGVFRKAIWIAAMLVMCAVLFLTASRAGFIQLVISGAVCLWFFAIKGRRLYLIVIAGIFGSLLLLVAGKKLEERFAAISGNVNSSVQETAYESYEERRYLMFRAIEGIVHYPVLGIGASNFPIYSGKWKEVHAGYLQIAVEGGIPVLILYLMFFARGFGNLRRLKKMKDMEPETKLFVGALYSALVGFMVGNCFAPEAYQYFPYFVVCFTSVLFAIVKEQNVKQPSSMTGGVLRRPDRYERDHESGERSRSLVPTR